MTAAPATSAGLLVLRLGVGGFLLTHGWGKMQMLLARNFAGFGDPIGIGNEASLVLIVLAEFVCALLVMVGLGTRLAAVPIVIAMAVAAFVAHGADPWTMGGGAEAFLAGKSKSWASKEPALLFLIPALALVFTGAGAYSLDGARWPRRRSRR